MAINWGSAFGSGNYQGRFGIEFSFAASETLYEVVATLYYQTRYKVVDSRNNFYVDWDGYADTAIGSVVINHPSNSSWSSSNTTKIGTWKASFWRIETNQTVYFSARCSGIEYGGNGATSFPFTVPALDKYKIIYIGNGGTGVPETQTKDKGETITLSTEIPERKDYRFCGWGTSAGDTTPDYQPGDTYSADESITLYAIWEERKNLIRINQNGTWCEGTVYLEGVSGTPYINVNGTWRKGGA